MPLCDHLQTDSIMLAVKANSKKHLIEQIASHAENQTGVPSREVFDSIMQRERLGSTGIGFGIAMPHVVLSQMTHSVVIMTLLKKPVPFDAPHSKPVDIVCTILGPKQADCGHLELLTTAAKTLSDPSICRGLRSATSAVEVKKCLDKQRASAA